MSRVTPAQTSPARTRRLAVAAVAAALAFTTVAVAGHPAPAAAAEPVTATIASVSTASEVEALLLTRMNKDRVARGLRSYRNWAALATLARERAQRMADMDKLGHDAAGGDIGAALDARGIRWFGFGEIIGVSSYPWGSEAALNIYGLWKGSPRHNGLMFSKTYNYAGVGVVQGLDGKTWISVVFTESRDHTRPIATNGVLSRSGTTVRFSWSGRDPRLQTHTAGLRSFDVQYRVDGGAWRTIRNDTTATSLKLLDRRRGHTYSLRVQAADRRGTLSKWTTAKTIRIP